MLAWWARPPEGEGLHLYLARSPAWAAQDLGALPEDRAAGDLLLRAGREAIIGWSYPTTRTEMIQWVAAGSPWPAPQEEPFRAWRAYALDGRGWAAAWRAEEGLAILRPGKALSETIPLPPRSSLEALHFTLDARGGGHIAWAIREEPGVRGGIYYALAVSGTTPIQVWPRSRDVALSAGPDGTAHLAWVDEGTLYYASSVSWQAPLSVAQGLTGTNAFALAAGPQATAHLVWASDGQLWAVSSAQWERPNLLAEGVSSGRLMAAADAQGRLHVVWVSPGTPPVAHYLLVGAMPPQLQVTYPIEGETLSEETFTRAESNTPYGWLERVAFYLQEGKEGILYSLGEDRTGADGWALPLSLHGLRAGERYRVIALGTGRGGEILRAEGGWFRVQPPEAPVLRLYQTVEHSLRGQGTVWAWAPNGRPEIAALDLYAVPTRVSLCEKTVESSCSLGVPAYLGHYSLQGGGAAQRLTFPLEALQDGTYLLKARLEGAAEEQTLWISAPSHITVERTFPPSVEIVSPKGPFVNGERLLLTARATSPYRAVQRVDFYLERAVERETGVPSAAPTLLWVGSDQDGVDGWAAPLLVTPFWEGGPWYAWAVAYDDEGLSARARSVEPFTILGPRRAGLVWSLPAGGEPVQGIVPIEASLGQGEGPVAVDAYLLFEGALQHLGPLAEESNQWRRDWDTRALADGEYRLALLALYSDGWYDLLYSPALRVANASAGWSLAVQPDPSQEALRGDIAISITRQGEEVRIAPEVGESVPSEGASSSAIHLFLRDEAGRWLPVADGRWPGASGAEWRTVWNSRTVLDGEYTLIALIEGPNGAWARLERTVTIGNETPSIAFGPLRPIWQGRERLTWQIEHPAHRPITVTAYYSPEGTEQWLPIGRARPGEDSLLWDTRTVPDSMQGRLRLTACDGLHCASIVSSPIRVENVNEAPFVALLSPTSREPQTGRVNVSWDAWDPDGDEITLTLEFRRGNEPWSLLRSGLPASGRFAWEVDSLLPGDDYALRLTARDSRGAQSTASVEGLVIRRNAPPTVRLVWPNESVRLVDRTAILYQASDRDRDTLTVSLYYSDNGGQTWLPLAEGLENTGYYLWQVSFLPPGAQYRVRVVASDGLATMADESDGVFAIGAEEPPRVSLGVPSTPLRGLQILRWTINDPDRRGWRAQIALRPAGKALWLPLADVPASVGRWIWNTRPWGEGAYEVRLALYDPTSGTAEAPVAWDMKLVSVANPENSPPRVALLTPQGGERWDGLHEIVWQATDADTRVLTATVQISDDGGASWRVLTTADARRGWALWDTRAYPPSQHYLVRLAVNDGQAETSVRSAGPFAVAHRQAMPPEIVFASLDGMKGVKGRDLLSWRANDADGDPLWVTISVSEEAREAWTKVASRLANTGEHLLSVPLPDQPLWVRLTVEDGLYRVGYEWLAPPSLRPYVPPIEIALEAPQGGDLLSGLAEIRWRALVYPVEQAIALDFLLSADGGLTWEPLAHDLPNTGRYIWDTTTVPNGIYHLRLVLKGETFMTVYLSPPFEVRNVKRSPPTAAILSPRGGEVWAGMQEIRWRAEDADGDALTINLAYSTDRGETWEPLAFSLANTGSYVWDTTILPNCEEVWFRLSATDGMWTAWVVSAGPVAVRNPFVPTMRLFVEAPNGLWQGMQTISWRSTAPAGHTPRVTLYASINNGPWQVLARDLAPQGAWLWHTAQVPEGAQVRLRVISSVGAARGIDTRWEPILIRGNGRFRGPFYPR